MSDPLLWHRLQFALTITYHYLFPQLTMGLALLIVVLKSVGLRTGQTIAVVLEWRGVLAGNVRPTPSGRAMLWILMLAFPFPYIANTAGWITTELGRQPWLVYGLMRTADGASPQVHSGTALFTLIGFTGLYFVLGVLFLFLIGREIAHGPAHVKDRAAEVLPHRTGDIARG